MAGIRKPSVATFVRIIPHNAGHGDCTGRQWTTVEYENTGCVWQAEEGFINGKWQRYFGFTGNHCIARAPAEEIEFPTDYHLNWQELYQGFDCHLETNDNYYRNPFHPGAPFPITLKLRNRRGVDLDAPETLFRPEDKALAVGVAIHLYRKNVPAAGEIVKEASEKTSPESIWEEVPRKPTPLFQIPAIAHHLAPTEELEVMSCDLGDFYDLSKPGEYYVKMTFDSEKTTFTGGTSNYIQFSIK